MDNKHSNEFATEIIEFLKILSRYYPLTSDLKLFIKNKSLSSFNGTIAHHIIYYLMSIISTEKTLAFVSDCWPLRCAKTRAAFREGVKKFVAWVNKKWPEAELRFRPSLLSMPSGISVNEFLLKLPLFTIKFHLRQENFEEIAMDIPELNFVDDCQVSEKLHIFQRKNSFFINLFADSKERLDTEYKNKTKILKKLDNEKVALKKLLEEDDTLIELINRCPVDYQSRLLSNENFVEVITDWSRAVDELRESNESKMLVLEELFPKFEELTQMINVHGADNATLNAQEILSVWDKNIIETYEKENKLQLLDNGKLSLCDVVKVNKLIAERIKDYFENVPFLISDEYEEELQKTVADVKNACQFLYEHYDKLNNVRNELVDKCNVLEEDVLKYVREKYPTRKPSNFFERPLEMSDKNQQKDSPIFSSPGISGFQLLQIIKKKIGEKEIDLEKPEESMNETPISRKPSQIPKYSYKQPSIPATNCKSLINNKKGRVLSSTLCSESSEKVTLLSSVESESLSPILKNSISITSEQPDTTFSDYSYDYTVTTTLQSPSTSRKKISAKSRPSIEDIIERYRSIRQKIEDEDC